MAYLFLHQFEIQDHENIAATEFISETTQCNILPPLEGDGKVVLILWLPKNG